MISEQLPCAMGVTGAPRDPTTTPLKRPGQAIVGMPGQPNGYDLAFLKWFEGEGARIWCYIGSPEVVTADERPCPFKVTRGMVKRLDAARLIERCFPCDAGIWDEWYAPRKR